MHVVLRGITIWTLYTFVSRVSVACLSTTNRVRLELVYDPMPDELFGPYQYHPGRAIKRLYRRRSHGMAAKFQPHEVPLKPKCNCTGDPYPDPQYGEVFPNLILQVKCKEKCQKIVYPIRMLTKHRVAGQVYKQDDLPADLIKANWWSYAHNITVACNCDGAT